MSLHLTTEKLDIGLMDQPNHERTQASELDVCFRFRRFLVVPRARQMLGDGRPVEIGSRAFDLLVLLLKERGSLVTKEAIMSYVWPATVVEEVNLRVQMAALRAALGEDRDVIKTIPGRGYVFAIDSDDGVPVAERSPSVGRDSLGPLQSSAPNGTLAPAPRETRGAAENEEAQPAVAIIDDDRDVREALGGLLRSVGMPVESFASIQEFLDDSRSSRLGCLVLDVTLPGRNGLDFLDDLCKADVRLPVVLISGHANVPIAVRAMKAGAVEFLTKPVDRRALLNAIWSAMEPGSAPRP
jgi:DNA-binding response OmpR family regulator